MAQWLTVPDNLTSISGTNNTNRVSVLSAITKFNVNVSSADTRQKKDSLLALMFSFVIFYLALLLFSDILYILNSRSTNNAEHIHMDKKITIRTNIKYPQ